MMTTLAHGAALAPDTFAEFVARLHHDTAGEGVRDHCTADAIFIVQQRVIIGGIDRDYTDQIAAFDTEGQRWETPMAYWENCDEEFQAQLNEKAEEEFDLPFTECCVADQWDAITAVDDQVTVTGWDYRWEYVCSHFTKAAAEAWIQRKKHDYREGLRVYVDAQIYCWEFNAIKEALRDGRLVLADKS